MVEIIPKPPEEIPLWQNILFYFSLALLIAAILGYFVLDNFQKSSTFLLEDLEETLQIGRTAEQRLIERDVLQYQKKIEDFSQLLKKHQKSSNLFELLEGLSHPKVWFSELTLNAAQPELIISGQTESFQTLGQQLIIFRQTQDFTKVNLSNITIGKKGEVEFTFSLSLDPEMFK